MQLTEQGRQADKHVERKAKGKTSKVGEGGKRIRVALVDLFAGLRTVHVAAEGLNVEIVLCHAAEKCEFANKVAKKNKIKEVLHLDVQTLDLAWAKDFVAQAVEKEADVILVFGGFPCKGLSRCRGKNKENLKNKDSKLFYDMLRIIRELKHVSGGKVPTKFVVENVIMDGGPEDEITEELGCRPVLIDAKPVCASARERLWWMNFQLTANQGEVLDKGPRRNELKLVEDKGRLNVWDIGWGPLPPSRAPCQQCRDGGLGQTCQATRGALT